MALAFDPTVLVMVYAVGHISGGHFNPAATLGAALAGRVEWKAVPFYMVAQVVGASLAGTALFAGASGKHGFDPVTSGFATNCYAERSPKGFAGISIGLTLTLIHPVSIPITNTSVNPARSLHVAWFAGPEALGQVWLFIVAPLIGAAIAGLTYPLLFASLLIEAALKSEGDKPDPTLSEDATLAEAEAGNDAK